MRSYTIVMSVFITLLTTLSTSGATNFSVGLRVSQVLAQTANEQKEQADELLKQGRQQYQTSEFQAALQAWQQALIIYRQIKDRQGEGIALNSLGYALYKQGHLADSEKTLFLGITVLESLRGKLEDRNKVSIFETQWTATKSRFLRLNGTPTTVYNKS